MFKFIKNKIRDYLYTDDMRDRYIKRSVGDQEKSRVEKLIFDVDGSSYKIQIWTVYGLSEPSPFDTVIDSMKNESIQSGSSILVKDSNKNTLVQITPYQNHAECQPSERELTDIHNDVIISIEKLRDGLEMSKWKYYDTTVKAFVKMLIRTPVMCMISFFLGSVVSTTLAPCSTVDQLIIVIAAVILGLSGAVLGGTKDLRNIDDAKRMYLEH